MTNEQKVRVDRLERYLITDRGKTYTRVRVNDLDTALSLIKEQDKKIEHLKENIDYKTLCDFLMSSVSDEEEPIWTEKHIEELLDNFEVRWKDAHK